MMIQNTSQWPFKPFNFANREKEVQIGNNDENCCEWKELEIVQGTQFKDYL